MKSIIVMAAIAIAFAVSPFASASAVPRSPTASTLKYQVCTKQRTDECIELGQYRFLDRETNKDYPQCAKLDNQVSKAACIESAFQKKRASERQHT